MAYVVYKNRVNNCQSRNRNPGLSDWAQASTTLVDAVARRSATANVPLVVSLDGRSGSGKSTMASMVAENIDAVVLPVADFYSAHISDGEWDLMTVQERWSKVFSWTRLRSEAVLPLLGGRSARWHPIDFEAGPDSQGKYKMRTEPTMAEPAPVIVLDGVYSSGPQMADLVGLLVLVEAPYEQRRARLVQREDSGFLAQWHARWDAVEEFYFSSVRPSESFDIIVTI